MKPEELTDQAYWDRYWENRPDVVEAKRTPRGLSQNVLLDLFDKHLPQQPGLSVLEIGGAPGQYLMYMVKRFGYKGHSLDYSTVGNRQTQKNFASANLPVTIHDCDLLAQEGAANLPRFDIVYSLGFVEHFSDLPLIVKRHAELVKPGGILMLGAPNLTGIYHWVLKRTAPQHLAMHNLEAMRLENWRGFERELDLTAVFRAYVTGFEPFVMKKLETRGVVALSLNLMVKVLMVVFSFHLAFLRRFNSRFWSGYLLGVYRKNLP